MKLSFIFSNLFVLVRVSCKQRQKSRKSLKLGMWKEYTLTRMPVHTHAHTETHTHVHTHTNTQILRLLLFMSSVVGYQHGIHCLGILCLTCKGNVRAKYVQRFRARSSVRLVFVIPLHEECEFLRALPFFPTITSNNPLFLFYLTVQQVQEH